MSWNWDVKDRRKRMTTKEIKFKLIPILQMGKVRLEKDK